MAVDAFIKFDGLEGEAHKVSNDFDRLGDGFTDLGGAFIKLMDDGSSSDTNFFKVHFTPQIKHDVFAIDQGFFKVGEDFIKLADPLQTFDNAVIKFWDETLKITPSDSETPSPLDNLKADFSAFTSDLNSTGLAFLGAASDIKGSPTESLSLTFNKISVEYQNQSDDVLKIKQDIVDLLDTSGISESKVGESFIKFTLETVVISSAALSLSTDFHKISTDLAVASDSGPMTFDQVVVKFADDFIKLAQDLKIADSAFTAIGGDIVKLGEALEHPGPMTTPTFKLG
jgi:hypothetical protein